MQVEDIQTEGLSQEYKVTVAASDIDNKMNGVLNEFRATAQIKGFRKGKAPLSLLKKMYGERAMGQVLQETVQETTGKLFEEKSIKPALQPDVDVDESFEAGKDLNFTVKVDVLPEINIDGFEAPALERWVAEADDASIETALGRLAEGRKTFKKAAKTAKSKEGDAVLIDYVGSVDGVEFEGGKGEDFELELGSNTFIPGFEDQLIGTKAGEEKDVTVTFPSEYHSDDLAGKEALFKVTVKEVRRAQDAELDDDFAKGLGLDDLDALKEVLKGQLDQDNASLSRVLLKRRLLDVLADQYSFDVPARMVDLEFQQIEMQLKRDAEMQGEDAGELSEEDMAEFKSIAERRVRLGLLLSEIGTQNDVQVTNEEISAKMMEEARRYPGQEREVFEYFQNNEQARAQLRAPVFEEKVVDFIIEKADVSEKTVTREELEEAVRQADEAEEKPVKKAAKKAPAKKAAPKKPASKAADDEKPAAKKAVAKKPAAKKAPAKKAAAKKDADK